MRNRAFVTRELPGSALARLGACADIDLWIERLAPPPDTLAKSIADCQGLLSMVTDLVSADILDSAPSLRVVSNYAVGVDNIDVGACTERGIVVGHTPGVLTESTADQTWALILATCRRLAEAERAVKQGDWIGWEPDFLLGMDVHGATLGIIGMGAVGRAVARRAHGFGMEVCYHDPYGDGSTLEQVLTTADIITLHCPLTEQTRGLIGAAELSQMKETAVLINAARGPIVDQAALAIALAQRKIYAAGLDVTETEPIALDDPLLSLPNCIVLPHLGSATTATREQMANMAVDNLLAGLEGNPLPHCAN